MITTNLISPMALVHLDGELYRFEADVLATFEDGSTKTVHREGLPFAAATVEAAEGRREERAGHLMFDVLCLVGGTR